MPTLPKHSKRSPNADTSAHSKKNATPPIEAAAFARLQSFDRKKAIPHAEMVERFGK